MKNHLLLFVFCSFFAHGFSQSVAQIRCDSLGKGINLSNWLEAYWDTNWPSSGTYTKAFLVEMKNAGMKSVRLPICFALITDTLPPYHVDTTSAVFARIDSVIAWTSELNMNLIIDNHHQWTLVDNNWRTVEPRLSHLWSVLAQRYNHLDPNQYFFEIFNEPNNIQNDSIRLLFTTVIDTIRQYAPAHSLIVSPNNWSGGIGYNNYQPLSDTNLIYTFHSYDPYPFTHQGFSWVTPYIAPGIPYPNSGYDILIDLSWNYALQWLNNFHLPLFLGEFGVGIYADSISRCNWINLIGSKIDNNHLSSFSWDVRGDFHLYHSGIIARDSIIPCFRSALHLYENQPVAIRNISGEGIIEIFPNPTNETLIIHLPENQNNKQQLQIFSAMGVLLKEVSVIQSTAINVSDLPAGIYMIQLKNQPQQSQKFIKQ